MSNVYVITEEPYHENSSVLGAFVDKEKAIEAFLQAPKSPPVNEYDKPESWEMGLFVDGKRDRVLIIHENDPEVCLSFDDGRDHRLGAQIDPHVFFSDDWTNESEDKDGYEKLVRDNEKLVRALVAIKQLNEKREEVDTTARLCITKLLCEALEQQEILIPVD